MEQKMPYLSDKAYENARWLVQIALPAFGAFYFGLSQVWGIPGGEQVVGTAALIATFLGVVVGVNRRRYQAVTPTGVGQLVVTSDDEGVPNLRLVLDAAPEDLQNLDSVRFDIQKESL